MKTLFSKCLTTAWCLAAIATTASANPTNFASVGQTNGNPQFTILNTGGTVAIDATGQDFFTFFVSGTPFGAPVLANFTLHVTSTQPGACGTMGCPNGDSFTEQGFSGSFSYIVATGIYAGQNLLSGTFGVNGDPTNSGGKYSNTIGGTGGAYAGTQTTLNTAGIIMTSDFLSFAGVAIEAGGWTLTALDPNFGVNPTESQLSLPTTNQAFTASASGNFSSEPSPEGFTPEPGTVTLIGSALIGLGLAGRKRLAAR